MSDSSRQRLAAILAADAAGYSRLMTQDETATMAALDAARAVFRSEIELHHGRVIDMAGDSVLAVFETATGAVRAALAVQKQVDDLAVGVPADRRMRFRIGVHLGDVIEKADGTVYGDGVNIAARLEGLATPGGITVSHAVQGAVRHRLAVAFEDLGEQQVKNIADPVRVFRVVEAGAADVPAGARSALSRVLRSLRWRRWAAGVAALLVAGVVGIWALMGWPGGPDGPPLMSVAVLPLKAAGAGADEAFAAAFTRELTAALGRTVLGSPVVSYETVASYRSKGDARSAGKDLDVRYVVEGEVARSDAAVVAGLALVDTQSARQVWSGRIETPAAKIAAWPALPALKATLALRLALRQAEQRRLANRPLRDASPIERVFRAQTMDTSTREGLERARALCDNALRDDPELAAALICKGWTIRDEIDLGPTAAHGQLVRQADDLSRRAVALAGDDAQAWRARALALFLQYQWQAGFEANAKSIQLDPSRTGTLADRASFLTMTGQPEEVFPLLARMADLEPGDVGATQRRACRAYLSLGRYDEAIASCERSASEDEHWSVHVYLAAAYAQKGDAAKAAAAKDRALARKPELTIAWLRAFSRQYSDSPLYWEQFDKYLDPGLHKAGFAEK